MRKSFFLARSTIVAAFVLAGCSSPAGGGYSNSPSDGAASGSNAGSGAGGASGTSAGESAGMTSGGTSGIGMTGTGASGGSTAGGSTGSATGAISGATAGTSSQSTSGAAWNKPAAATAAAQFPFPQNRTGGHCTFPSSPSVSVMNSQVTTAYSAWKANFVSSAGAPSGAQRVVDPQGDPSNGGPANRTVSEAIGYGMLIAVYMNDKALFDGLWAYAQAHMKSGLMSWEIDQNGSPVGSGGSNSATDADEDMGWALLMADKQWGGNYLAMANTLIGNIKSEEVNSQNTLSDGNFGGNGSHPDYASPGYYKEFGSSWSAVSQAEYGLLNNSQNKTTGLIPDSIGGSTFGYDACRAPWRVGIDYCFNGSPSAQSFLTPMVAFFVSQGATNLKLPIPTGGGTGTYASAAISGPAGIGAMMSASNQSFIDASWTATYQKTNQGSANASNYFGATVGMVSLLVMSGNFFDYRSP